MNDKVNIKKEKKEADDTVSVDNSVPVEVDKVSLSSSNPTALDLPLSPWQADKIKVAVSSFSDIEGSEKNINNRMYAWLRSHYDVNSYKKIRAIEYNILLKVIRNQYSLYVKYLNDEKELKNKTNDVSKCFENNNSKEEVTEKDKKSKSKSKSESKTSSNVNLLGNKVVVAKRRSVSKLMALCLNKHMKSEGNVASLKEEFEEYRTATDMAIAWHPSEANGSAYIGVILKRHDLSNFNIVGAYAGRLHDKNKSGKKCRVSMYPPEVQEIVLNELIKEGRIREDVLVDLVDKI